jgi:hypothetical protein
MAYFLPSEKLAHDRRANAVIDEKLIEQLNRGYVCPPDAGPAWREACEYGLDMSLVEDALGKTLEERLEAHQRALDMILELKKGMNPHGSEY